MYLLRETIDTAQRQRRELVKENELVRADLGRYQKMLDERAPHRPERIAPETMQLAFEEVLKTLGSELLAANETSPQDPAQGTQGPNDSSLPPTPSPTPPPSPPQPSNKPSGPGRHKHGRRPLILSGLPVQTVVQTPQEVRDAGGVGFEFIGQESSDRIAYRPGVYLRLRVVREKYKRIEPQTADTPEDTADESVPPPDSEILIAPVPASLWPGVMADPSVIAHHIVAKYDDLLPLNRQETISTRAGFTVPRSTMCGWLALIDPMLVRVVDAMMADTRIHSHCIATDATGVRVRIEGERVCAHWHVFVFMGDHNHVVFRYNPVHTGATIRSMVKGYEGYLLLDASSIYDALFGATVIEVGCWQHLRRYIWKSLSSEPKRATEWLAIISRLFEVDRETKALAPQERTMERCRRALPILELMEKWLEREKPTIEERTPLRSAVTYYENQKLALHRFLADGTLRLDNNESENSLRKLVLGLSNWQWFANEAGVRWYCTFRSLIASCRLHGLNAQIYLEQLIRLIPHWPTTKVLALSPKYWRETMGTLTPEQRDIITPSWGNAATVDAAFNRPPLAATG